MFYFRRIIVLILTAFLVIANALADEGMWVPLLLNQWSYERMKELGCRLSAEELYSINHASLKDAVVLFDRGCSGVMVSDRGLLLTNHHCGFKAIQNHRDSIHDYIANGFWAMSQEEELPNPSLTVSFLVRMEDVTTVILSGITDSTSEIKRNFLLQKNIEMLEKTETKDIAFHRIVIKPLYNGNQFFLYEYEVFHDVRLVGAPPAGIAKFGGETDNWMWPRHTGDFAVFRVYADKDNHPAYYSPGNVPYKPKKFIPISLKGVEENDFTLAYGYPASVQPFLTSIETEYLMRTELPRMIDLRAKRLSIISEAMEKDASLQKLYDQRYNGTSSTWKKWQGELKGLVQSNAILVRKRQESEFEQWLSRNDSLKLKYGKVLEGFNRVFPEYAFYSLINRYSAETFQSIEMLDVAGKFNTFIRNVTWGDSSKLRKEMASYRAGLTTFYKNFDKDVDQQIFAMMMQMYYLNVDQHFRPEIFNDIDRKYKGDFSLWAKEVYAKSIFSNGDHLLQILDHLSAEKAKRMLKDPAIVAYQSFGKVFNNLVVGRLSRLMMLKDSLTRLYTQALMIKNKNILLYPEANQTLRISYGKVEGYKVADAVDFLYFTTLDGIMQKDDSTSYDYHVPAKLKELYIKRDYGPYAARDGKMRVCFLGSDHTSGGSSGSPVLNANGELVGLNFDRNWEGTMNEILYDPKLCRNISLDIRYVLFVIDKFAGARYLLDEMNIVKD